MTGQKHGLDLRATLEALAEPGAELVSADGCRSVGIPGRPFRQVQNRAFDAARVRGILEWIDYAVKPTHGQPTGGRWKLKGAK